MIAGSVFARSDFLFSRCRVGFQLMKATYTLISIFAIGLVSSCKQSTSPSNEQGSTTKNEAKKEQVTSPEKMKSDKNESKEVSKEAEEVVKPATDSSAKGDDRYIGLTQEAAMALAKKEGVPSRVVSVDGEVGMVTMDYRPDRLNFTVVKGKVTKVTRG